MPRMKRKVLHVIGSMNRGGVETWLMHVLRTIDRQEFEFHFVVQKDAKAAYDDEIRSLGAQIHPCLGHRHPLQYGRKFKDILDRHGPFDVVHSHIYTYTGFIMRFAAESKVPIRIAHSHTAPRQKSSGFPRLAYRRLMRALIARYATNRVGVSRAAVESLFGKRGLASAAILPYGLDFRAFLNPMDIPELKSRLGIPQNRKLVGHVGRFDPVKNHKFLIDTFAQVIANGTDAHLLLVGDGPLLPSIRRDLEAKGLSDRCMFAGLQPNVPPFLSAMDVFVFPSLHEGIPLAVLEAQAAGVPIVASPAVPAEMDIVPNLMQRIPLDAGAPAWADAISKRLTNGNGRSLDAARLMQNSAFALPVCVEKLTRMYTGEQIGTSL